MRPLPRDKRYRALTLLKQGKSVSEAATMAGLSRASVGRIRNEDSDNIPPHKLDPKSWVSDRTKRVMARQFDTGQLQELIDGQEFIRRTEGVDVSKGAIKKYLKQKGIKMYIKQHKPDIEPEHIRKRLKFACDHDIQQYIKVLRRNWVKGCNKYNLLPRNMLLMQDNTPWHKSKVILKFLVKQRTKPLKDWPPLSPELNPIEKVWTWVKDRLGKITIQLGSP
ncbi:hypothetical protein BG015_001746 [Linnemannia schmuckeri]|uniref:Transposase n=1 Tax=Linnemannia schmuckeri TaxID=64567 RepID=A0A9P5RPL8_9FUNG|nr:hypothetical protein BG015_001746 [Linnemannia schmuckeri]